MKVDYFTIPEVSISFKDKVKTSERAVIRSSADAARIMATAFEGCMEHHEEMYALLLNRANRVMGITCIAKGGLSGITIDVRIVLQTALKASCSSILICHNHPSGSTLPSQEDKALTKKIKEGCHAVGLELSDHLIVTEESYTSFADEGLL
jgi:DNA repair protein RadC